MGMDAPGASKAASQIVQDSLHQHWTRREPEPQNGDPNSKGEKDRQPISWQAWKGPASDEPKRESTKWQDKERSKDKPPEKHRESRDSKADEKGRSRAGEKDVAAKPERATSKREGETREKAREKLREKPREVVRLVERKPERRSPPRSSGHHRSARHPAVARSRSPRRHTPPRHRSYSPPVIRLRSPRRRSPSSRRRDSRSPPGRRDYLHPSEAGYPSSHDPRYRRDREPESYSFDWRGYPRYDPGPKTYPRPYSPSLHNRIEHDLPRRPPEGHSLPPLTHDSSFVLSELERLKHLERLRRMELEMIEREKQELEMGLRPAPYPTRTPPELLPTPYRHEDGRPHPWDYEGAFPNYSPEDRRLQSLPRFSPPRSPRHWLQLVQSSPKETQPDPLRPLLRKESESHLRDEAAPGDPVPERKRARTDSGTAEKGLLASKSKPSSSLQETGANAAASKSKRSPQGANATHKDAQQQHSSAAKQEASRKQAEHGKSQTKEARAAQKDGTNPGQSAKKASETATKDSKSHVKTEARPVNDSRGPSKKSHTTALKDSSGGKAAEKGISRDASSSDKHRRDAPAKQKSSASQKDSKKGASSPNQNQLRDSSRSARKDTSLGADKLKSSSKEGSKVAAKPTAISSPKNAGKASSIKIPASRISAKVSSKGASNEAAKSLVQDGAKISSEAKAVSKAEDGRPSKAHKSSKDPPRTATANAKPRSDSKAAAKETNPRYRVTASRRASSEAEKFRSDKLPGKARENPPEGKRAQPDVIVKEEPKDEGRQSRRSSDLPRAPRPEPGELAPDRQLYPPPPHAGQPFESSARGGFEGGFADPPLPPLNLQHNFVPGIDYPDLPPSGPSRFSPGFGGPPHLHGGLPNPGLPFPGLPHLEEPFFDRSIGSGLYSRAEGFNTNRNAQLALPLTSLPELNGRYKQPLQRPSDHRGRPVADALPGPVEMQRLHQERMPSARHSNSRHYHTPELGEYGQLPDPPALAPGPAFASKDVASKSTSASGHPPRLRSGLVVGGSASTISSADGTRRSDQGSAYARTQSSQDADRRIPSIRPGREDEKRSQWYYMDPQGIVQGPASKAQLQIWLAQLANADDKSRYQAFCRVNVWRDGMRQSEGIELFRLLNAFPSA